ncbi:MAG: glutamate mutase L [Candidatus Cloacimonetes bacterium]|nr:glutamate mutase L [Candidatus Cloacimonadota bacterium]
MPEIDYILITDIGSTTTKAILIDKNTAELLCIEQADTTVEKPKNDVNYGVFNAAAAVEKSCSIKLLDGSSRPDNPKFLPNVKYLSTSSAGGGLQILVVGLTLFDSASSAKRAAYGAGGVILDVFAIDDKRSALEQMLSMRNLRPDMILLCGGTDGGAIVSVLRLAEILRIAKPLPKFSTESKIPTIYAGNTDASEMIERMISKDFDLHILPNLRPTLDTENLKPTQSKIQELFMENVMERAPGYSKLKQIVNQSILPTPAGVLKSILNLRNDEKQNLIAFDVGGATTDVFTRINEHYQRTVSANLGMSYSALNVLKENGIDAIKRLLPDSISETEIRNYIGNKTLYPTTNPQSQKQYRIEHAVTKSALKLSFLQHQDMHYNTEKMGYLEALKNSAQDKYEEKFEYMENEKKHSFYPSDIDLVIGAGGVFAHAQNPMQCIDILIGGFKPSGITELAIDHHFISPHLGVLSESDEGLAAQILTKDCLKNLALYVRPLFPQKKGISVLEAALPGGQNIHVRSDSFQMLQPSPGQTVKFTAAKKCYINGEETTRTVTTDLPIIIDTRLSRANYSLVVESTLNLYSEDAADLVFGNDNGAMDGEYSRVVELPYRGDIQATEAEVVSPDDIVAVNRYNPPRLYVIHACTYCPDASEQQIREHLQIQKGDKIDFDQILMTALPQSRQKMPFKSPVRGKVEFIDYRSGIVVASEIQDYSTKPVQVNLASKMAIPPKKIHWYLKKRIGDFVYQGDMLAQKLSTSGVAMAISPTTGEVIDYDKKKAIMTIHYKARPHNYLAHVPGTVTRVEEHKAVAISYQGKRLDASIGWGNTVHGSLQYIPEQSRQEIAKNSILALGYNPDLQELKRLADSGAIGIICPSVNEGDLVKYLGLEQGVINTGLENIKATLILMQGFGDIPLTDSQKEFFSSQAGRQCLLEPHTRIRAGVMRASVNIIS